MHKEMTHKEMIQGIIFESGMDVILRKNIKKTLLLVS